MEDQTRQLLRLLSDDFTDRLIAELLGNDLLLSELQKRLPESRQTLVRRLEELRSWGITVSDRRVTPGRGRPTTVWRLVDDWAQEFQNVADGMVLDLLDRRFKRQQKGIRQRMRRTTKGVDGRAVGG